jgi:DNA repair protein RecN (Recombination protein N)
MLNEIIIKNFAIIENLNVSFSRGLNILTGETGAGKSILIDALSGVLGEKMTTDMIRSGCEKATLEGIFDISETPDIKRILDESGIDADENRLVLRRELYASGRGRCFANSANIPISKLKEISDNLVDIHGQNEHQNIVKVARHRELLDNFAGTRNEVAGMREIHTRLQMLRDKLNSFNIDEREKARRIEYNTFALREIDAAALTPNEEEELKQESVILSNAEKLFNEINISSQLMNSDGGVLQNLKKIEMGISAVSEYDSNISDIVDSVRESLYSLEDASQFLKEYERSIDFSPERINQVEERLSLISTLKKKYGDTIEEVLEFAEKARNEIEAISSSEDQREKLNAEYRELVKTAKARALALSEKRGRAALTLEEKVMKELNYLGMSGTVFRVSLSREVSPHGEIEADNKTYVLYPHGLDKVEFMLSANRGEELRQLKKVASGGEMSRIMLALKNVILSADIVESLVFDEVDTGISGKVAEMVGKKLKFLAGNRQVLVITHLPQIAAMGDTNYSVAKGKVDGRVTTKLEKLDGRGKINEVARLLAGETVTELSLKHAEEMVSMAEKN